MRIKVLNSFEVGKNHYGYGIFASRDFKINDVIVQFRGPIVSAHRVPKRLIGEKDRYVQIGEDKFMGPSETTDDFINHSCEPNSGLRFTDFGIILVAIKRIHKGDEITWDYSTTMHNNPWEMKCLCKSKHCRGIIREFKYLPMSLKKHYTELNIVPDYIKNDTLIYRIIKKKMDILNKAKKRVNMFISRKPAHAHARKK